MRQKELCLNCLDYHKNPMCHSKNKCRKCNAKHNTLSNDSVLSAVVSTQNRSPTSQLNVRDAKGNLHTVQLMIDPCSQGSFISDALCKRLQLSTRSDTLSISGFGGRPAKLIKKATTLELSSKKNAKVKLKFSVYVLQLK